jgi:hypothetical protein
MAQLAWQKKSEGTGKDGRPIPARWSAIHTLANPEEMPERVTSKSSSAGRIFLSEPHLMLCGRTSPPLIHCADFEIGDFGGLQECGACVRKRRN